MKTNFSDMLNNILTTMSNRMTLGFDNAIRTPGGNSSSMDDPFTSQRMNKQVYIDLLKNYWLFNALAQNLVDPISDIIRDSELAPTVKGASSEAYNAELKKLLISLNLKTSILQSLSEMITWGGYIYYRSNGKLVTLINPHLFEVYKKDNELFSVRLSVTNQASATDDEVTKLLPAEDLFTYYFKLKLKDQFSNKVIKEILSNIKEDPKYDSKINVKEDTSSDPKELEEFITHYSLHLVEGIFDPWLKLLLKAYILEYIHDTLSLAEYLRSHVIKANASSAKTSVAKVYDNINRIESILNNDNYQFIYSMSDPMQLIAQINEKIINKYRVVPEIPELQQMDVWNIPDFKGLLDQLKADIENSKKSIINGIGLPEDYILSTTSQNRWEVISKTPRYYSMIKHLSSSIEDSIKNLCSSHLTDKFKKVITSDMIDFEFNLSKYTKQYDNRTKLSELNNNLRDVDVLLSAIDGIMRNPSVDKQKYIKYLTEELKAIDPALSEFINMEVKNKSNLGNY